jgi:hypothetical protein
MTELNLFTTSFDFLPPSRAMNQDFLQETNGNIANYFNLLKDEKSRFNTQPTGDWKTWLLDFVSATNARKIANGVWMVRKMTTGLPTLYKELWSKIVWHIVSDQPIFLLWQTGIFYCFYNYDYEMMRAITSLLQLRILTDGPTRCHKAAFTLTPLSVVLETLRQHSHYIVLVAHQIDQTHVVTQIHFSELELKTGALLCAACWHVSKSRPCQSVVPCQ